MDQNTEYAEIFNQVSVLYELSLSTGNSLDVQENCDRFLKKLMSRKRVTYVSVWIKDEYMYLRDEDTASLVYANPEYYITQRKIAKTHPLFSDIPSKGYLVRDAGDCALNPPLLKAGDLKKGTCIVYPLNCFGILELHWLNELKDPVNVANQLDEVISKFAFSLEASLLHKRALWEAEEKNKAYEARMNAESMNRAKNEFLATMSHELRTPLNSIIGFSDALLEGLSGELNNKQIRYIGNISKSGKHLLSIINDILDLSKIEADEMTLNCVQLSVMAMLEDIAMTLKPISSKKNVSVTISCANDTFLEADPDKLKQILLNLIGNAVKFSHEGGTVDVSSYEDDGMVRVLINDNGIGISAADQQEIFKPFKQLDSSLDRRYGGTGLGLYLVKKLTEIHGGAVSVKSEVGKGSTFTLSLPVNPA
ncbi:sensor histidine kinase [Methanolobus sp. WCC5]|uniref:sensor histidine kinase n=1 Tax=Methanolobus sp. WCC5 TaxID=3125785 RepID=UPI00324F982C